MESVDCGYNGENGDRQEQIDDANFANYSSAVHSEQDFGNCTFPTPSIGDELSIEMSDQSMPESKLGDSTYTDNRLIAQIEFNITQNCVNTPTEMMIIDSLDAAQINTDVDYDYSTADDSDIRNSEQMTWHDSEEWPLQRNVPTTFSGFTLTDDPRTQMQNTIIIHPVVIQDESLHEEALDGKDIPVAKASSDSFKDLLTAVALYASGPEGEMEMLKDLGSSPDSQLVNESEGSNQESKLSEQNLAVIPSQKSTTLTSNPSPTCSKSGNPNNNAALVEQQNDSAEKTKMMKMKSIAVSNIDSLNTSLELLLDGCVQEKKKREIIQSTMVQLQKLDFLRVHEDDKQQDLLTLLAPGGTKAYSATETTAKPVPTHVKVGKFKVIRSKWAEAYECVKEGDIKKASIILFDVLFNAVERRTCTLRGKVRSEDGSLIDGPKLDPKKVEAIIRSIASMKHAIGEEWTNVFYFNKDGYDKDKAAVDIKLTRQAITQKLNENKQSFKRAARCKRVSNDAP